MWMVKQSLFLVGGHRCVTPAASRIDYRTIARWVILLSSAFLMLDPFLAWVLNRLRLRL